MSMTGVRVQRLVMPSGRESTTVLADGLVVDPAVKSLERWTIRGDYYLWGPSLPPRSSAPGRRRSSAPNLPTGQEIRVSSGG